MAAFPPDTIRLDLVIHLLGPSGLAQYSIERRDGLDGDRQSLVVRPHIALTSVGAIATADFLELLSQAREDLAAF